MIDNYLNGNKLITNRPIQIVCEHYQLMGKPQKVALTIKQDIEILDISKQTLLFVMNNNEYIYRNKNIEEFITDSFVEQAAEYDLDLF